MKDEILAGITRSLRRNKKITWSKEYVNMECDRVIQYEQNGKRYLITIEEL